MPKNTRSAATSDARKEQTTEDASAEPSPRKSKRSRAPKDVKLPSAPKDTEDEPEATPSQTAGSGNSTGKERRDSVDWVIADVDAAGLVDVEAAEGSKSDSEDVNEEESESDALPVAKKRQTLGAESDNPFSITRKGKARTWLGPTHQINELRLKLKRALMKAGMLKEVVTLTNLGGHRPALEVSLVDIRFELHDKDLLKRIYVFLTLSTSGDVFNPALANPSAFECRDSFVRSLKKDGGSSVAEFFTIGVVTLSSLQTDKYDDNRQVCARLMWETFPRTWAFFGAVMDQQSLYIPSFSNGVSFSTLPYRVAVASTPDGKGKRATTVPSPVRKGARFGNFDSTLLPAGVNVPVYDRTTDDIKFTLANYARKLPTYSGEVPANSTVLIVFTTGPYDIPNHRIPDGAPKYLSKSTSLNIKAIVVLYKAITVYSRTGLPEESSWGVIPAPVSSEGSGDGAKEDSGDEGAF